MKKILFAVMALALLANQAIAANHYGLTALIGGGAGALDSLDITGAGAPNVDNLADGDSALVTTISGTTVLVYWYIFDLDGTTAESSPTVIRPDDYATQGVWRLAVFNANAIPDISATYQPADADLTTWAGVTPGTGIATALAVNVGSAGAPVLFDGAGGTPSSVTLTNATGLPLNGLANPGGSLSLAMGANTLTKASTTDGWGGEIIETTVANNASPTTLLTLQSADANDSTNIIYLDIKEDSDGTPVSLFTFKGRSLTLGTNATIDGIATLTASTSIGTTAAEIPNIYVADNGVIYGQNDQSNTITSGSNGWTFSNIVVPVTTSGDQTRTVGQIGLKTDEDLLVLHGGANGEVQDEVGISLLQHISFPFDPSSWYDQESTYRSVPLMTVGDDFPHGFTLVEWSVTYVAGDPTTELDADLICDTTPDYNTAAGATVMDVLDTTTGASSADTGFDSATCANGSKMYIHFGADPTDANVVVMFEMWGYAEED